MFKKILVHARRSVRMLILLAIAAFIMAVIVISLYHTTYSVKINGEEVGYTKNKSELQKKINEYIQNGDEDDEGVAFVQIQNMPEYEICLLKRDISTNDDEILEKVKAEGIKYYRYYAISENDEEKLYVSSFEEAEKIVNDLNEKNSQNKDNIKINEKYETGLRDFTSEEDAVAQLYVAPARTIKVAKAKTKTSTTSARYASSGSVNTATTTSGGKASIGISFIKPVSGVISSRFGARSSMRRSLHTGLDIATAKGTPIKAAASGTVTFSGWKGSYGNLLVISHGNGVQTYYGHCSALYVKTGATVSQGQTIAAVGSTGNSTGPHLHLEVRVNGVAYNPQNYVY